MERSLEMVGRAVGNTEAGGAYVPLDPAYPPERLQFMVEDAQASVLLTESKFQEALSAECGEKVYLEISGLR